MGDKTDPNSFRQISKKIDKELSNILFITDNPKGKSNATTKSAFI